MGESIPLRLPASLHALALPNYRRWAAADLVSNVGSWMSTGALGWLVYEVTGSAAALGAIIAAKQVPGVLLGLVGGAVADRYDARRILLMTQSCYAAVAAVLAVLVVSGHVQTWHLYAFALVTGLLAVLDGPCFGRLLAEVLGRDHLDHGLALGSMTHSVGWVLGLGAGSLVMAGPGAGTAFALDAVSFGFVVLTVGRLRPDLMHPLERAVVGAERIRDGLAHVLASPRLVTLLCVAAACGALGRHYQVTMAAMSDHVFGGGPDLYGRFFTCFSVGAVIGAAAAVRLPRLGLRVLVCSGAAAGLVQAVSGAAPTASVFAVTMVGAASLNVVYDTALSAAVQHHAPGAVRGRILAVQGLVSALASLVGAPTLGWLADSLGPRAALEAAGCVVVVAVMLGATALLRHRSRAPEVSLATSTALVAEPLSAAA